MLKPFLRWAGGKTRLLPTLLPLLPADLEERSYHEPFVGGGALFFAVADRLNHADHTLWDDNHHLMGVYERLRRGPAGLFEEMERLTPFPYSELVDAMHAGTWASVTSVAAFLLVNRRCFNGLYRENKNGRFNVPEGRSTSARKLPTREEIFAWGAAVEKVRLSDSKWNAGECDAFFYFDPPYDGTFSEYTSNGFARADQIRLAAEAFDIHEAGSKFMLSNSDTPLIRELYQGFEILEVQAPRSIAAKGSSRKPVGELLIRNYSGVRSWP